MSADAPATDPVDPPEGSPPPQPDPPKASDRAPSKRTRKRATKATAAPSTAAPKTGRKPKAVADRQALERQLAEAFGMIGMGLMAIGTSDALRADGMAVIERAESLAQALGALAEQNESVRRVLTASVNGGAWFGVIAAFSGLGVAIAQNHQVIPPVVPLFPADPTPPTGPPDASPA